MLNNTGKSYRVKRVHAHSENVVRAEAAFWQKADVLSDFRYPWEEREIPDLQFRALYDNEWLYCHFRVRDDNVLTYVSRSTKEEVLYGDRVELFLAADDQLSNYYGLEIDANARVYDYRASHYRKFNPAWNWPPSQLRVTAEASENGYHVVIMIGMKSLADLELLKENSLRAGIFRGKCMEVSPPESKMHWISWVRPQSPFPDFHIPSAFGSLLFVR